MSARGTNVLRTQLLLKVQDCDPRFWSKILNFWTYVFSFKNHFYDIFSPSFAECNAAYNFETPANDYGTSSESDGPAPVKAVPACKSSVKQVKTMFLTYLWISQCFPISEQYESDVVDGHFRLDAGYLGYMGLEPPFPRVQVYLAKIGQWTSIPLGHPIPISRLIRQDGIPTVLLHVAGVIATEGLDKIVHDAQAPKTSTHDPLASQMAEWRQLLKQEMDLWKIELSEQLETGRGGSRSQSRSSPLAPQDSASQISFILIQHPILLLIPMLVPIIHSLNPTIHYLKSNDKFCLFLIPSPKRRDHGGTLLNSKLCPMNDKLPSLTSRSLHQILIALLPSLVS
jgi:hypothetical protein